MALASASASAVRRLNCRRRGDRMPTSQCRATSSTASPTSVRSLAMVRDSAAPGRWTTNCNGLVTDDLKRVQRLRRRLGDGEQCIELGQLEQGLQVLVQSGQPQLPTLLTDLLGERHEHAESGRIDVAGLREVDDEPARATLEGVEHLLLQLLTIADDQLAVDTHDHDAARILIQREAHPYSFAWRTVTAAVSTISSTVAPRDRSAIGRASPCKIGPIASHPANRCTSL